MTDDPQQPVAPAGKDPLAVLEELLAKQKASTGSGGNDAQQSAAASSEVAAAPDGPTPEEVKATQLEELGKLEQEAAARDQAMLQVQTEKFEEIKSSPQYQARLSQEKDIKDKKSQHHDDNEGYEIFQLEKKKIDVPVEINTSPTTHSE